MLRQWTHHYPRGSPQKRLAMNLFIDTNIFLEFYHFSGADIEELHKLTALLQEGGLKLFATSQLCEEFERNRDHKIKDALNEFNKTKFTISVPAFCKLYPEYKDLRATLNAASAKHAELSKKAIADVNARCLKADDVIHDLFAKANIITIVPEVFSSALKRFQSGNPPGKKKTTIGDELNWEALLYALPNKEILHLVSGDSDYAAAMDPDKINRYLESEWEFKKSSSVKFYKSLQDFFKANFPDIKIASDVRKNALIEQLSTSASFAVTHLVIKKLNEIKDFSPAQVEQLILIAEMNGQVGWIMGDNDLFEFYNFLLNKYAGDISPERLAILIGLLPQAPDIDDEIPW